ncbi:uncharacterized protein ACA1_194900 [Acanthamoeba castellanii str. Neff]|uniref:Sugar transporter SWEET1 n=1 Tax=Acanthamoeba castellanii (strain ATCC 30010 / Neff) TaxID=1257118 RepID=L8H6P1_ACACF|nr:uncharacterized protein ACA1_194900 [Acanthamoeba castellanii str. Neff]ELR20418.1 hypothetical protein ACA1_194900 [Acanthamoeba castellanii str. Neff]
MTNTVGLVLSLYYVFTYFSVAKLSERWTVVRTRSTRTMSFPLSIMSCLVTLSWTAYGLHVADNFIFYPNAVG